jgi:hypothetical protein
MLDATRIDWLGASIVVTANAVPGSIGGTATEDVRLGGKLRKARRSAQNESAKNEGA